jgi:site-specific DNA recombinase
MVTTATQTLTAGIYVRISSDPEATRLGVQRQEQDCREYVTRQGWTLAKVYEDNDLSAYSGKARPAYRQLLEDVRGGAIQVVVAWHPDRMHRHPRDLEEFIEVVESAGARVETVKAGQLDFATPSGRMVARLLGATARYESEHKAERQRRKHQELAAAGKDAGGGRPFGYNDDRMTTRPDEAKLIKEAVDRALGGESLRSICRDWTARGVPTVTGAAWSSQVMRRMLASARISGRREHRGTLNGSRKDMGKITSDHAVWTAIISPADSDRIRAMLSDPARRANTYAREYLLTGGIARCGLCGKPLIARPRGDHRRSMVCASGPGFHGCGKIRVLAEPVEDLIAEAVLQAVDGGALASAMAQQDDHEATEGLLALEAKLAELGRAWADDEITRGAWDAARGRLEGRRASLQRRVDAQRRAHDLDGLPDPLRAAWPSLPIFKRRAIIQALIEAVDVGPAVKGRNYFDPARVSVRWKV